MKRLMELITETLIANLTKIIETLAHSLKF